METKRRLALMIDGDNAQATLIGPIMTAVSKYGEITIRRVFGDWTSSHMNSWKDPLNIHALQPAQQFSYTTGKNATDSALIIEAMDLLYTAEIDGFCIVSSDSDYTRLVTRIREKNLFVMGVGRKSTPAAFIQACDKFVFTDDLTPKAKSAQPNATPTPKAKPTQAKVTPAPKVKPAQPKAPVVPKAKPPQPKAAVAPNATPKPTNQPTSPTVAKKTNFKPLFQQAFAATAQEDGWAHLGALGSVLRKLDPDFDPRAYGHKLLSQLVEAHPAFIEIRKKITEDGNGGIYIRLKGN
jgi:uncharacterized LabA/DUF88 family protein